MKYEILIRLTVKELRILAADQAIIGRSTMRKAELVTALRSAMARPSPTAVSSGTPRGRSIPVTRAGTTTATPGSPLPSAAPGSPLPSEPRQAPPASGPEPGLPIPERYGVDRLALLPQDPHHLYAWWELTGPALASARARLGEDGRPVLLIDGGEGREQRDIDLAGGSYYLTVAPDREYRAALALRGSDGRLVEIVATEPVRTPADRPNERSDEDWMAVDQQLERRLAGQAPIGASERLAAERIRARLWRESGVGAGSSWSGNLSSWS